MAKCDLCGQDENMPYQCRYCGNTFCGDHRLPENHSCPGLQDWGDPKGVFDSGFDSGLDQARGDGGLLGRIGLGSNMGRTGGLLGYVRGNASYFLLAVMWSWFIVDLVVAFVLAPTGNIWFTRQTSAVWAAIFTLDPEHPFYVWTWITSIFSHGDIFHLAINSIVLYFFGPIVERRVGTRKFLALFLIAGAVAGLAQIGTALALGDGGRGVLGASGAIMAIMGVLTVLNPSLRVYLYFILPVPLWLLTFGFALYSVFRLGGGVGAGGVAHLAHLAGLVMGLAYGEKLRREGEGLPSELQLGPGGGRGPGGPRRRW